MKCQNLFSGKNQKKKNICHMLKILPGVLSVKYNVLAKFLINCHLFEQRFHASQIIIIANFVIVSSVVTNVHCTCIPNHCKLHLTRVYVCNSFCKHIPSSDVLCFAVIATHFGVWSSVVKVSCILHHQCVQLLLAYSWARPAILVAGKGSGWMF